MVKNKKGGKRSKKLSSKGAKNNGHNVKLRLPREEGEIIARVTKTFGHGMLEVLCNDGVTRLCIIRKKFRGRNRRDNDTKLHSFLLVGIRAFEVVAASKKQKCDLIYVYTNNQKIQLKQGGHIEARLIQDELKDDDQAGFKFVKDGTDNSHTPLADILEPSANSPKDNTNNDWLAEMIDDI